MNKKSFLGYRKGEIQTKTRTVYGIEVGEQNPLSYMRERVVDNFNIGDTSPFMHRAVTSCIAQALLRVNKLYKKISNKPIIPDEVFERYEKLSDKLYAIPTERSKNGSITRIINWHKMRDIVNFLIRVVVKELPMIYSMDFHSKAMEVYLMRLFYCRAFRGDNILYNDKGNKLTSPIYGREYLVKRLSKIDIENDSNVYYRKKRMSSFGDYEMAKNSYKKMHEKSFLSKSSFDAIVRIVRCRNFDAVLDCMIKDRRKFSISDMNTENKDEFLLLILIDNYFSHLHTTFYADKKRINKLYAISDNMCDGIHKNSDLILSLNMHFNKLRKIFVDIKKYMKGPYKLNGRYDKRLENLSKMKVHDLLGDTQIISCFTNNNKEVMEISEDPDKAKFAYDYIYLHDIQQKIYDGICIKNSKPHDRRADYVYVLMHYLDDIPGLSSYNTVNVTTELPINTSSINDQFATTKFINHSRTGPQNDGRNNFSSNGNQVLESNPVIRSVVSQQNTSFYNSNNFLILCIISVLLAGTALVVGLVYRFYNKCTCTRNQSRIIDRDDDQMIEEYPLSQVFSDNINHISNNIARK